MSHEIDLTATIQDQGLNIRKLDLNIGEENRLDITGSVTQLAEDPRFNIRLNTATFKIEDLIAWAGTMIPAIKAMVKILVSNMEVKGHMTVVKSQDLAVVNAHLGLKCRDA